MFIIHWIRSWIETLIVAPPFSKRRADLLEVLRDKNPDNWVKAERPGSNSDAYAPEVYDLGEDYRDEVDPDAWGPAGYLLKPREK